MDINSMSTRNQSGAMQIVTDSGFERPVMVTHGTLLTSPVPMRGVPLHGVTVTDASVRLGLTLCHELREQT